VQVDVVPETVKVTVLNASLHGTARFAAAVLSRREKPGRRPGFVFVEAGAEARGLIFRDDRRRNVSLELVA
jgi:hypothetical protein